MRKIFALRKPSKILLLLYFILANGVIQARCETNSSLEPTRHPSLISSIRLNSSLNFCAENVPLEDQMVREHLEMALMYSLQDRAQVILWLKRSGRYMSQIEKMLKENNMPDDLKYIAVVESALRPHAVSSKGAVGFWQFIGPTGTRYGLKINSEIDERRNIFTSTHAAILYLNELYKDLGSWTLAAAAYNMGEDRLKEEIREQKTSDFYTLYLFLETRYYIFKIISAKLIFSNPEIYGFHLAEEDLYPPLRFDYITLTCSEKTPIAVVAEAAGTYFSTIKMLNPEIRGNSILKGTRRIAIPEGASDNFKERYDKLYAEWITAGNGNEMALTSRPETGHDNGKNLIKNIQKMQDSQNTIPWYLMPDRNGYYPYTIHVGSYRNRDNAAACVQDLAEEGLVSFALTVTIPGKGEWHRVFAGYFGSAEAAEQTALILKQQKSVEANVLKLSFAVQAGIYASSDDIEKLKSDLQSYGFSAYTIPDTGNNTKTRLLIGAYRTPGEAEETIQHLHQKGFNAEAVPR